MNDTQVNRDCYIEVIYEMLKRADLRCLRLVWIFASGIIDGKRVVRR